MENLRHRAIFLALSLVALVAFPPARPAEAQAVPPSVVDPALAVRTVATGFVTPVNLAFIGRGDMLVLEKNTGQVKRVVGGAVQSTVLDLAVNNSSERGLLGIALPPDFETTRRRLPVLDLLGAGFPRPHGAVADRVPGHAAARAPTRTTSSRSRCSATASTASCGTDPPSRSIST